MSSQFKPVRWAILQVKRNFPPKHQFTAVEIGVYEGDHADSILAHLDMNQLHLVDRWGETTSDKPEIHYTGHDKEYWDQMYERVTTRFSRPDVTIHRMDSIAAASLFEDSSVDFIYLDATHTYEAVMADLIAWYPKIRVSGYLVGDDWRYPGVKEAVKEFFEFRKHTLDFSENEWVSRKQ